MVTGAGRLEVGLLPDDACQNPERALRRVTEQLKGILCRSYTQAAMWLVKIVPNTVLDYVLFGILIFCAYSVFELNCLFIYCFFS